MSYVGKGKLEPAGRKTQLHILKGKTEIPTDSISISHYSLKDI